MQSLIQVYVVIFLITCSEGTIHVIFPPFLESLAYAVSQIGVLSSLFAVLQLAARLPAGAFYAPQRARVILVGGLALLGLTALGFPTVQGLVPLVALIGLHGFAFGTITTVALALCIDTRPKDYPSGAMMGWYTSAIAAGYAVGQPIGGYLADEFGFPMGFGALAGFSLLAILILLSLPRLGQSHQKTGPIPSAHPATAGHAGHTRHQWSLRFDPRRLPAEVLLATLIVFFVNMMFRSLHTFFPLYALAAGITLTQIGLLRSMLSLAAAVVRPFSGKLFQVIHYRRVNHMAMIGAAASVLLSPLMVGSMTLLAVLHTLMGLSRGLTRVTSATMLAESNATEAPPLSPPSDGGDDRGGRNARIGIWSGVYNAGLDLGSITGPAVGGILAGWIGIPNMLGTIAIGVLGTYVFISLLARRRRVPVAAAVD
ncbi:MAG TPA: MFS transporter [Anaerolineae bacterium]|nr:MFS transporter [Anaerolineae bacterium]